MIFVSREAILTILMLSLTILVTIVGNILVILSVLNHAPLKILSNYFVMSLAVADLTVSPKLQIIAVTYIYSIDVLI